MERKEFLKRIGWSAFAAPAVLGCQQSKDPEPDDGLANGTPAANSDTCEVTPSETAGPFPTKNPSSLVLEDIRADRTGVRMNIKLTIQDYNLGCEPLAGAIVDIWHCDKDGYYSEYGGTGMQPQDFTTAHFLRGRQTTNSEGQVGYTTIFPGWYSGRAPHLHVQIYDATGKSLLVTQIAFPTSLCDAVYTTATDLYTKGKQDTANTADNIFADSLDQEMAVVSGSISDGYELVHRIVVRT